MEQKRNQTNLDKWCEGKPEPIAWMGRTIVLGVDELSEMLTGLRDGEAMPGLSELGSPTEWVKLYDEPERVQEAVAALWTVGKSGAALKESLDGMQKVQSEAERLGAEELKRQVMAELDKLGPTERQKVVQEGFQKFAEAFEGFGEDDLEADEGKIKEILKKPEAVFFFRVTMPCWIHYGEFPAVLMKKAREGDVDTLEMLLRLDSGVIYDPAIAAEWRKLSLERTGGGYRQTHRALEGGARGKLDPETLKESLGGLLCQMSDELAKEGNTLLRGLRGLNVPDIRELFDAAAKDKSGGALQRDGDLTIEDETFRKAIRKHKAFWEPMLQVGKK